MEGGKKGDMFILSEKHRGPTPLKIYATTNASIVLIYARSLISNESVLRFKLSYCIP